MRDIEKVHHLLKDALKIAERIVRQSDLKLPEYGRISVFETARLERSIKEVIDSAEAIFKMPTYQETITVWVMKDVNGQKLPQQVEANLYSDNTITVRGLTDDPNHLSCFSRDNDNKWHGWEVDDTEEGLLKKFLHAEKSSLAELKIRQLNLAEKVLAFEQLIHNLERRQQQIAD